MSKPPKATPRKTAKAKAKGGGGPTASGGFNYQAAVTAIVMTYAVRGARLGWLDGLAFDAPISVASETGSGGDDLRLVLADDAIVEAQVKKGLTQGPSLWSALLALAASLAAGKAQFGVLVVSPSSSAPVRDRLAKDIILIAEGSQPKADGPGAAFLKKLKAEGWDPQALCAKLRIVTVAASGSADGDVRAALAHLAGLCTLSGDADAAWDRLYRDAHVMQESRGVRPRARIAQTLRSGALALKDDPKSPSGLLERLCRWTTRTNCDFYILGVDHPLSIHDAYIPLHPYVRESDGLAIDGALGLAAAVARYHDWDQRTPKRDAAVSDPRALGRFFKRAVVVAGPGTGKSTLLSRVATAYAADGFGVLKASALAVHRRMNRGQGFEDALFAEALDGSGVTPHEAKAAGITDWVVLLDGLDETGGGQTTLVGALNRFTSGHPDARVIVTTRPVGYQRAPLSSWRHYELPGIAESDVDGALAKLLSHILPADDARRPGLATLVETATARSGAGKSALRTPLMLGLAAALFASGGPIEGSRTAFYRGVFEMLDRSPPARLQTAPPSRADRNRFLDALGWILMTTPAMAASDALSFAASVLRDGHRFAPLAADGLAEKCSEYWQALGVIEELRHADDHALAFVHKTFGEFAAGRYLAAEAPEVQRAALALAENDAGMRETVAFAAAQGFAPLMLSELATRGLAGAEGDQRLAQALDILIEAAPPTEAAVAQPILAAAFAAVLDDRRGPVAAVGLKLRVLAPVYRDLILPQANLLFDHPQTWTRLTGLAVSHAADPAARTLDEWIGALVSITGEAADRGGRVEGFTMGDASTDLVQALAGDIAERIVAETSAEEASDIFERAFVGPDLQRVGFIIRMERLIQGTDIRPWWRSGSSPLGLPDLSWPDTRRMMQATFSAFMRGLQGAERGGGREAADGQRPLYALSAFMSVIGFGETALPELWPLEAFGEAEEVRSLWRDVARLAGIPLDALSRDAADMEADLAEYDGEALSAIFLRTFAVDVPEPAWDAAIDLPLEARLVEAALRRPSALVISPACQVAAGGGPALIRVLASRLLLDGQGSTLWAASALAAKLPRAEALDLLFGHACGDLRSGSSYVFQALAELHAEGDSRRPTALEAGLLQSRPRTAQAAAEWAAQAPVAEDLPLLMRAFDYWLKIEKPYPVGGGIIPTSPRATLLTAILELSPEPWGALLKRWEDSRSDVRTVVQAAFSKSLSAGEGLDEIVQASGDHLPIPWFRIVVDQADQFSEAQVERLLETLESREPQRRLAAMRLLESGRLDPVRRKALLTRMRGDPVNGIRERAADMLRVMKRD